MVVALGLCVTPPLTYVQMPWLGDAIRQEECSWDTWLTRLAVAGAPLVLYVVALPIMAMLRVRRWRRNGDLARQAVVYRAGACACACGGFVLRFAFDGLCVGT